MATAKKATKGKTTKTSSKKGSPLTKKELAQKEQEKKISARKSDIAGVILIAVGILLGLYIYGAAAGWIASWLIPFLKGTLGMFALALPVILFVLGVLTIVSRKSDRVAGSKVVIALTVIFVVALIHVASKIPYADGETNMKFGEYVSSSWTLGNNGSGGGVIGGVIAYCLQIIGGNALAYVVIICVLIICTMLLTRISLRTFADMFRQNISHVIDRVEFRDDELEGTPRQGKLYTGSMNDEPERKKAKKHRNVVPFDEAFTVPKAEPVPPKGEDGLSFMPTSGKLEKRTSSAPIPVVTSSVVKPDLEPVDDVLIIPPAPDEAVKSTTDSVKVLKPKSDNTPAPEIVVDEHSAPVYVPPVIDYLNKPRINYARNAESPQATAHLLEETLLSFNISAKVVNIAVGPVVTRFELQPAPGVRVNRITTLSNDIALALAAPRVRIEAPIPGKAAIGIEIPNKDAATVVLRDIIESTEFALAKSPVTMALGKDIGGKVIVADLSKMPHMLIAGSTGSGKSVCINDLIISMIYKSSPQDLRLILVDPKMVELSVFATLPHLLIPVVTDPKKAASALRWAVNEMTLRYKKFSELGARDLARYNELQENPTDRFPKVVVIIDELADLMMVSPDEVEDSICRVAQLGRAAGIHLIVATQRPSADVITGLIKANIPSRCAFAVSSSIDSRIILDSTGAEKLLGRGDMLFHPNGSNKPVRLQCAFVSDEEVERITSHFKPDVESQFDQKVLDELSNAAKGGATGGAFGEGKQDDELLSEAVRIVLESGQASISMIQRRLRVGYARAARLIDIMEQHGYVSGFDGSKPRKVLIKHSQFEEEFGEPLSLDIKEGKE
ncbi:MAG: DNA translocase FtsK [Eubacteriales bacterium]|nr:DNA translocase FtsK [Eubacteriales bacterium]